MTDLSRVAILLGLDIKQSDDNKYITVGQREYVRNMRESMCEICRKNTNSCTNPIELN